MPKISWLATGAVALVAAFFGYRHITAEEAAPYRFATVEKGDLESAVSATGILNPVTSVQVGTQVSGKIVEIFADFNDQVKKGQLIARIDPTLQQQAVKDAEAGLERSRAEAARTRLEYERNKGLYEAKVLTEVEFNTAKYANEVAQAELKSAHVAVDRARQNLAYTSIYAPIDGVVVERNVNVGQTVASNYSTPQLFLIAKDLSQMQILASVDESDIGLIRQGQAARFTVQAYPNQNFSGHVQQARLQSTTTENVVNYTVVVTVPNPDGRLLPGMTATVEFLTGEAKGVLMVPNAALRFRPPQEALAQLRERGGREPGAAPRRPGAAGTRESDGMGTLWYLDAEGALTPARVKTGITDGQKTEVSGSGLEEGGQVVVGTVQVEQNAANPFQPMTTAPTGGPRR
jgi:HlyD family secretion protein